MKKYENEEQMKTYIDIKSKRKFQIIRAIKGYKSESIYIRELIKKEIEEYEKINGKIRVEE